MNNLTFANLFNFKGNIPAMGKNIFEKALKDDRVKVIDWNKEKNLYELVCVNYITHNDQWQDGLYNFHKVDVETSHGFNILMKTYLYTVIYYGSCNWEQKYFVIENTKSQQSKFEKDLENFNPNYRVKCLTYHQYKWDDDIKKAMVSGYIQLDEKLVKSKDDEAYLKLYSSISIINLFVNTLSDRKEQIIREQKSKKENKIEAAGNLTEEEKQECIKALKEVLPKKVVDEAVCSLEHPYPLELEGQKLNLKSLSDTYQRLVVDRNIENTIVGKNKKRQLQEQILIVSAMMAEFTFKFDIADEMGYGKFRLRIKYNFSNNKITNRKTTQYISYIFHSIGWGKDLFLFDSLINTHGEAIEELVFTINNIERNKIVKLMKFIANELQRGINFFTALGDFDLIG